EQKITANDGEWHNAFLSSKGGVVRTYLDDELIAETKNVGSSDLNGHVFRIGESTKQFWVGASKLPKPLRGQLFDGQIANVRFFDYSLTETDIKKLAGGEKNPRKPVLDWRPKESKESNNVVKGPIRLQSDTSKIRFANIWVQPLRGK
nr:LamG domain-containing protein [Candidatus Poribacteria bacterium]